MIAHVIVFVLVALMLVGLGFAAGYAVASVHSRREFRELLASAEYRAWQRVAGDNPSLLAFDAWLKKLRNGAEGKSDVANDARRTAP